MRYLLDTNVLSELRKGARADPGVRRWIAEVASEDLAISVLVLGEIRLGILRLHRRDPDGAGHLATWLARLAAAYRDRTLAIDRAVVEAWAGLNAGRSLPVIDSLQAATAVSHGLTLVTRNVKDLRGVAAVLLNPFSS